MSIICPDGPFQNYFMLRATIDPVLQVAISSAQPNNIVSFPFYGLLLVQPRIHRFVKSGRTKALVLRLSQPYILDRRPLFVSYDFSNGIQYRARFLKNKCDRNISRHIVNLCDSKN